MCKCVIKAGYHNHNVFCQRAIQVIFFCETTSDMYLIFLP
jgi:hypothetical protein